MQVLPTIPSSPAEMDLLIRKTRKAACAPRLRLLAPKYPLPTCLPVLQIISLSSGLTRRYRLGTSLTGKRHPSTIANPESSDGETGIAPGTGSRHLDATLDPIDTDRRSGLPRSHARCMPTDRANPLENFHAAIAGHLIMFLSLATLRRGIFPGETSRCAPCFALLHSPPPKHALPSSSMLSIPAFSRLTAAASSADALLEWCTTTNAMCEDGSYCSRS